MIEINALSVLLSLKNGKNLYLSIIISYWVALKALYGCCKAFVCQARGAVKASYWCLAHSILDKKNYFKHNIKIIYEFFHKENTLGPTIIMNTVDIYSCGT